MTDDRLPLAELLAKDGDQDFLRTVAESVLQLIMEADVEGLIGAGRFERSAERATWRNGHRERSLETRLGTLLSSAPALGEERYDGIFHLASAVSAECEMDFELGLRSNLDSTRALLDACAPEWIGALRPRSLLELGAGSAAKTRVLLDAMHDAGTGERYIPVDVSSEFLEETAREVSGEYPRIQVSPVAPDFVE